MSYSTIRQNNQLDRYYTEYSVDTIADLATLPTQPRCSTGSTAICLENSEVYMLNSQGEWVML